MKPEVRTPAILGVDDNGDFKLVKVDDNGNIKIVGEEIASEVQLGEIEDAIVDIITNQDKFLESQDADNDIKTKRLARKVELLNTSVEFEDEAEAETEKILEIPELENLEKDTVCLFYLHNESEDTSVSLRLDNKWEDEDENERSVEIFMFDDLGTEDTEIEWVEGFMLATGAELEIINNEEIGVNEGFKVYIKVIVF